MGKTSEKSTTKPPSASGEFFLAKKQPRQTFGVFKLKTFSAEHEARMRENMEAYRKIQAAHLKKR